MHNSLNGNGDVSAIQNMADKIKSSFMHTDNKIIISYVGEFNQNVINTLSSETENKLIELGISKKSIKKIFNVIIETLQNIVIHGKKDEKGLLSAYFMVINSDNIFHVFSGNFVSDNQAKKIQEKIENIKNLKEEKLKEVYMEVLSNGELSDKGGAGLGLITIALKSDDLIEFSFENFNNNNVLFSLHSKVKD